MIMISKLLPDGATPKNVLAGAPVAMLLTVNPEFTINNRQVALELARKGFGAALLISVSTSDDLEDGTLARLSEDHGFG